MEVKRIRALRGPNRWSRHTAIEAVVHCAPSERDIAELAGFEARLRERFPNIGVLPKDRAGRISFAHILEAAALGLQEEAGCPVTFSQTDATEEDGVSFVVVEYSEEDVGRKAVADAQALIGFGGTG